ncbi:ribonuclease HII [Wenzhouxiangella sp. AB-CW3]|uniref:ribonuclease HII n=1 Tax=Wenzhouxiangella sp. AB-CW3 TaxID=2771012 RepID=UPI001CC2E0A3|nr:ribonuclease HII [Wenzhouxiangella sp. AB-CW3]
MASLAEPSGHLIAGVDEAGRGPLAGPVVAAAVMIDPARPIEGLADSKKLTARRREKLAGIIRQSAVSVGIAVIEAETIDRLNILQATLEGMRQAVAALSPQPAGILVDGNQAPRVDMPVTTLVGGDGIEDCIAAASIIAKVHRDGLMLAWHERYPEYGFARHKGYPTAAHLSALQRLGPCPAHRRSFRPVTQLALL